MLIGRASLTLRCGNESICDAPRQIKASEKILLIIVIDGNREECL